MHTTAKSDQLIYWERGGVPKTSSLFSAPTLESKKKIKRTLDLIRDEVNAPEVHAGRGKWTILVQGNVVNSVT